VRQRIIVSLVNQIFVGPAILENEVQALAVLQHGNLGER